MLYSLVLVAHVVGSVAGLHAPGATSIQPVGLNLTFSQCSEEAHRYQQQEGSRGSFVCMPNGASIVGYPVALR